MVTNDLQHLLPMHMGFMQWLKLSHAHCTIVLHDCFMILGNFSCAHVDLCHCSLPVPYEPRLGQGMRVGLICY